jgi:hypothetical protein
MRTASIEVGPDRANCADRRAAGGVACGSEPTRPAAQSAAAWAAIPAGRGWLLTVLACLVAVLILLVQGYFGYAGVTFAVAISAAINLV